MLDNPFGFGDTRRGHQQHVCHSLDCPPRFRSQVRPRHDDDEAARDHAHMRDLGERQPHEGDFSYEDITGQVEPPVDSPPAPKENTVTRPPGPNGERQMDVDPEARRRMRGQTRLISLEQTTVAPVNASTDTTRQEAERNRDDKRRRVHEPGSPISTVAQDEVSTLGLVPFDSETTNDEKVRETAQGGKDDPIACRET